MELDLVQAVQRSRTKSDVQSNTNSTVVREGAMSAVWRAAPDKAWSRWGSQVSFSMTFWVDPEKSFAIESIA